VESFSVTPSARIFSISAAMRLRGRRYSGMPNRIIPPASSDASSTVTAYPSSARSWAAESPAGPAPTTATLRPAARVRPKGMTGR